MDLFCNSCCKLASSILLEKNPHSLSKKHIRVLSLLCIQLNVPCLNHTGMERTTFYKHYKECTNDTEEVFAGTNTVSYTHLTLPTICSV